MEFNSSPRSTIGVEVEYGIVSRETGELMPVASELLAALVGGEQNLPHPKAKNELFQASIEVITGICENPAEARADLATTLNELKPLLDARGLGIESTGTHPFAEWNKMAITPNARYLRMVERLQWPAFRLAIHGVHVHVGVRSPEKAIITTNVVATYLPLLLALSCSSPYWLSDDTGLASARTKIFETMPTTGVPPRLADWDAYNALLDALIAAETIETVREIWWDIRPHPDFGTVEFRMCDGIPTLRETMAVAAIAQGLVTWIDEQVDAGIEIPLLPDWVLRENKWRACRYGLDAELITDQAGNTQPLREQLDQLIEKLRPYSERFGSVSELEFAHSISTSGASYQRQRAVVDAGGSLQDVVAAVVAEFDADLAATDLAPATIRRATGGS